MNRSSRYLWMAVTVDEYELPLVVEDTASSLAKKLGITVNAVTQMAWRYSGKQTGIRKPLCNYKIVKIEK